MSKGPSIIIIIFTYDNFYRKREGGGLKNDDNYCNSFCISLIVVTKMMITIVRGGREGVREL